MFKEFVQLFLHYDQDSTFTDKHVIETIKRDIRKDVIQAFELSKPLIDRHPGLFQNSNTFLDFLFKLCNINFNEKYPDTPKVYKDNVGDNLNLQKQLEECQENISKLKKELQKCNTSLDTKKYDHEQEVLHLKEQHNTQIMSLKTKNNEYEQENLHLKRQLEKCRADLNVKENEYDDTIRNFKEKLKKYRKENEKLSEDLYERETKNKFHGYYNNNNESQSCVQNKISELENKITLLECKLREKDNENQQLILKYNQENLKQMQLYRENEPQSCGQNTSDELNNKIKQLEYQLQAKDKETQQLIQKNNQEYLTQMQLLKEKFFNELENNLQLIQQIQNMNLSLDSQKSIEFNETNEENTQNDQGNSLMITECTNDNTQSPVPVHEQTETYKKQTEYRESMFDIKEKDNDNLQKQCQNMKDSIEKLKTELDDAKATRNKFQKFDEGSQNKMKLEPIVNDCSAISDCINDNHLSLNQRHCELEKCKKEIKDLQLKLLHANNNCETNCQFQIYTLTTELNDAKYLIERLKNPNDPVIKTEEQMQWEDGSVKSKIPLNNDSISQNNIHCTGVFNNSQEYDPQNTMEPLIQQNKELRNKLRDCEISRNTLLAKLKKLTQLDKDSKKEPKDTEKGAENNVYDYFEEKEVKLKQYYRSGLREILNLMQYITPFVISLIDKYRNAHIKLNKSNFSSDEINSFLNDVRNAKELLFKERDNNQLQVEFERIKTLFHQIFDKMDHILDQIKTLEDDSSISDNKDANEFMEQSSQSVENNLTQIPEKKIKNEKLEARMGELSAFGNKNETIGNYDSKDFVAGQLKLNNGEIEKLNKDLQDKNNRIKDLEIKLGNTTQKCQEEITRLQWENDQIQQEFHNLSNNQNLKDMECQNTIDKCREAESIINNLKSENEKLRQALNKYDEKYRIMCMKSEDIKEQSEKIMYEVQSSNKELQDENNKLQDENNKLQDENNKLQDENNKLQDEIAAVSQTLDEKFAQHIQFLEEMQESIGQTAKSMSVVGELQGGTDNSTAQDISFSPPLFYDTLFHNNQNHLCGDQNSSMETSSEDENINLSECQTKLKEMRKKYNDTSRRLKNCKRALQSLKEKRDGVLCKRGNKITKKYTIKNEKVEEYKSKFQLQEENLTQCQQELEQCRRQGKISEDILSETNEKMENIEKENEKLVKDLEKIQKVANEHQSTIDALNEKLKTCRHGDTQLVEMRQNMKGRIEELNICKKEIESLEQTIQEREESINNLQRELQEDKAKMHDSCHSKIEELNIHLEVCKSEIKKQTTKLQHCLQSKEKMEETVKGLEKIQKVANKHQSTIDELNDQLSSCRNENKKLIETRQNIERVLGELNMCKKEILHLKQTIQQREESINNLQIKLQEDKEQMHDSCHSTIKELTTELQKCNSEKEELTVKLQKCLQSKEKMEDIEKEKETLVKELEKIQKEANEHQSTIGALNDKLDTCLGENTQLRQIQQNRIEEVNKQLDIYKKEIEHLEQTIQQREESINNLQIELQEDKEKMTNSSNSKIEEMNIQLEKCIGEKETLNTELQNCLQSQEVLKTQIQNLQNNEMNKKLKMKLQVSETENQDLYKKLEEQKFQVRYLTEFISNSSKKYEELQNENDTLRKNIERVQSSRVNVESVILKQLVDPLTVHLGPNITEDAIPNDIIMAATNLITSLKAKIDTIRVDLNLHTDEQIKEEISNLKEKVENQEKIILQHSEMEQWLKNFIQDYTVNEEEKNNWKSFLKDLLNAKQAIIDNYVYNLKEVQKHFNIHEDLTNCEHFHTVIKEYTDYNQDEKDSQDKKISHLTGKIKNLEFELENLHKRCNNEDQMNKKLKDLIESHEEGEWQDRLVITFNAFIKLITDIENPFKPLKQFFSENFSHLRYPDLQFSVKHPNYTLSLPHPDKIMLIINKLQSDLTKCRADLNMQIRKNKDRTKELKEKNRARELETRQSTKDTYETDSMTSEKQSSKKRRLDDIVTKLQENMNNMEVEYDREFQDYQQEKTAYQHEIQQLKEKVNTLNTQLEDINGTNPYMTSNQNLLSVKVLKMLFKDLFQAYFHQRYDMMRSDTSEARDSEITEKLRQLLELLDNVKVKSEYSDIYMILYNYVKYDIKSAEGDDAEMMNINIKDEFLQYCMDQTKDHLNKIIKQRD